MTEFITITYKPIMYSETNNLQSFIVTPEKLLGMILMAGQLSSPERISIKKSNGDIIDTVASLTLPNVITDLPDPQYNYTVFLNQLKVQFQDLDFIRGAVAICILLGVNPATTITQIKNKGQISNFKFDYYLGNISVPGEGYSIPLDELLFITNPGTVESLSKSLYDCFHVQAGIIAPSNLYIITQDANYIDIVASAAVTSVAARVPAYYRIPGMQYIYNVCVGSEYRGQGLGKSILIALINGLINEGASAFTLEVDPDNLPAYKLYTSLGFFKIDETHEQDKTYDLLYLSVDRPQI